MKSISPVIIGEGSYPLRRNSKGSDDTWSGATSNASSYFDAVTEQNKVEKYAFDVRYACIQEWFQRASWQHKYNFIVLLLRELEGINIIRRLLLSIGDGRPKDMIYEMSQNTANFVYDILPQDDDRCLDSLVLNQAIIADKIWFTTLQQPDQLFVIHGLLRLGGGSLIQMVHDEIVVLIHERCQMNLVIEANEPLTSEEKEDVKPKETESLQSGATSVESKKGKNKSKVKILESTQQDKDDKINDVQDVNEPEETLKDIAVRENLATWEQKMSEIQEQLFSETISKSKSSKKNQDKSNAGVDSFKDNNENENLDQVQMLPLWANRAIIKNFRTDILNTLKKVNRYWAFMVDEVKKDIEARKFISNTISKLQIITSSMEMLSELQEGAEDESDEGKLSEHSNPQVENVILKLLKEPKSADIKSNIYCGRHHVNKIDHTFFHFRVVACGPKHRLMAVTTISRTIIFYSLLTGSLLFPCLQGHTGIISALDFHPNMKHIFSGSYDTTIRCWDIWTQCIVHIFTGHQKVVTSLSVSWDYFASCGLDNQVKVFKIASRNCWHTFVDEHPLTAVQLVMKMNIIYTGGQDGEIGVYDFKKEILIKKVAAHGNGVRALYVSYPFLLSGGGDGFVRVWNCEDFELSLLLSMDHGSPVQSVNLSRLWVLSGDSRGRLCVWSVLSGSLLKSIHTSPEKRCILQLFCIRGDCCDKVVMCGEASLKIYEFIHPLKKKKKCVATLVSQHGLSGKVTDLWHLPLNQTGIDGEKITRRYQRLQALRKRCCTDPKTRNIELGPTTTSSIMTDAMDVDPSNYPAISDPLTTFPRVLPFEENQRSFNFRKSRLSPLLKNMPVVQKKPVRNCKGDFKIENHKNVLQLYNVYHVSI